MGDMPLVLSLSEGLGFTRYSLFRLSWQCKFVNEPEGVFGAVGRIFFVKRTCDNISAFY